MADRPILFSGAMVRAILEGRKTQTRRPIPERTQEAYADYDDWCSNVSAGVPTSRLWEPDFYLERSRIAAGDRLWVREATMRFDRGTCDQHVWYRAGYNHLDTPAGNWWRDATPGEHSEWPRDRPGPAGGMAYNVPSMFMPRWASRLTLVVTDVRVERLQDISDADAIAEGIERRAASNGHVTFQVPDLLCGQTAPRAYRILWEAINGPGSWEANPWVAAYTFEVRRENIDALEGQKDG